MAFAYANVKEEETPRDPHWANNFPWPYPYPPYPTPDNPPYPPPVDPDDDYPDDQGDTYRFTHIVKAINNRLAMLGQSPCSLSTTNPDRLCTYDNINTARGIVEDFYDDFILSDISGKYYGDSLGFADYHELLGEAGVRGMVDGKYEWHNLNSSGGWYSGNDMASSDQLHPYLFYELESVLKILTHTASGEEGYNSLGAQLHYSNGYPDRDSAWEGRMDNWNGTGAASILAFLDKDASGNYYVNAWGPGGKNGVDTAVNITEVITSPSVSLNRKHKLYVSGHKSGSPGGNLFVDLSNTGFTEKWALQDADDFSTSTSATLEFINKTLTGTANWSMPSFIEPPAPGDYTSAGIQGFRYYGVIEWDFEDNLGKFEK